MCNFNKLDEDTKLFLSIFMKKAAKEVGGVNFLLALIEAIKKKNPYPLSYKECKISSNNTTVKWNKVVFKDKAELLDEVVTLQRSHKLQSSNILDEKNQKRKKKILNMVKTLLPVEFIVTPQNKNDGGGFSFKVFESVEDDVAKLNPVFVALFFCSVEFTKKALKYEI